MLLRFSIKSKQNKSTNKINYKFTLQISGVFVVMVVVMVVVVVVVVMCVDLCACAGKVGGGEERLTLFTAHTSLVSKLALEVSLALSTLNMERDHSACGETLNFRANSTEYFILFSGFNDNFQIFISGFGFGKFYSTRIPPPPPSPLLFPFLHPNFAYVITGSKSRSHDADHTQRQW